jgi:hypothetical protein
MSLFILPVIDKKSPLIFPKVIFLTKTYVPRLVKNSELSQIAQVLRITLPPG